MIKPIDWLFCKLDSRRFAAIAGIAFLVTLGVLVRANTSRAQPSGTPVQISETGDGDLVIEVPSGCVNCPDLQIPGDTGGLSVSVAGQPVPGDSDVILSFPQGGKITIRPCTRRDLQVTGKGLVMKMAKRLPVLQRLPKN